MADYTFDIDPIKENENLGVDDSSAPGISNLGNRPRRTKEEYENLLELELNKDRGSKTRVPVGLAMEKYKHPIRGLKNLEGITLSEFSKPYGAEQYMAENQLLIQKAANAIAGAQTMAATSFLDSTVGVLVGLGSAASGGSFVNNKFSQWMQKIQGYVTEDLAPLYREAWELDAPWYKKLHTANFWGDALVNMGYSAGQAASIAATGGTLNALKGAGTAAKFANTGSKIMSGGSKIASNASNAYKTAKGLAVAAEGNTIPSLGAMAYKADDLLSALQSSSKKIMGTDKTIQRASSLIGSMGYARSEALSSGEELYNDLMQEMKIRRTLQLERYLEDNVPVMLAENPGMTEATARRLATEKFNEDMYQEIAAIEKLVHANNNTVFALNLAYMAAAGDIMFGRLATKDLTIREKLAKHALAPKVGFEVLEKNPQLLREGLKPVTKSAKEKYIGGIGRHFLKNPSTEFVEEMFNEINSSSSIEFYKAKYDPEAQYEHNSFLEGYLAKVANNFSDIDEWESGVMGFIGGGMGVLGPTRKAGGKMKVGMQGGVWDYFRGLQESSASAVTHDVIDKINQRLSSGDNLKLYQAAIRRTKYMNESANAAALGDEFVSENADISAFVNDLILFDELGLIDEYMAMIKAPVNMTAQEAREVYAAKVDPNQSVESEDPNASPELIDIFEGMSDEEVVRTLEESNRYYSDLADYVIKTRKSIEPIIATLDLPPMAQNRLLDILTDTYASIRNSHDRINKATEILTPALIELSDHIVHSVTDGRAGVKSDSYDGLSVKELDAALNREIKNALGNESFKLKDIQMALKNYQSLSMRLAELASIEEFITSPKKMKALSDLMEEDISDRLYDASKKASTREELENLRRIAEAELGSADIVDKGANETAEIAEQDFTQQSNMMDPNMAPEISLKDQIEGLNREAEYAKSNIIESTTSNGNPIYRTGLFENENFSSREAAENAIDDYYAKKINAINNSGKENVKYSGPLYDAMKKSPAFARKVADKLQEALIEKSKKDNDFAKWIDRSLKDYHDKESNITSDPDQFFDMIDYARSTSSGHGVTLINTIVEVAKAIQEEVESNNQKREALEPGSGVIKSNPNDAIKSFKTAEEALNSPGVFDEVKLAINAHNFSNKGYYPILFNGKLEFAYLTNDNRVALSTGARVDPKNKVYSIYASYRKHNITHIDAFDLNSMSVVNVELAEQRVYFMPNRTESKPLQLVSEGIESDLFFKGAYKIGDQVTLHLDKDTGSSDNAIIHVKVGDNIIGKIPMYDPQGGPINSSQDLAAFRRSAYASLKIGNTVTTKIAGLSYRDSYGHASPSVVSEVNFKPKVGDNNVRMGANLSASINLDMFGGFILGISKKTAGGDTVVSTGAYENLQGYFGRRSSSNGSILVGFKNPVTGVLSTRIGFPISLSSVNSEYKKVIANLLEKSISNMSSKEKFTESDAKYWDVVMGDIFGGKAFLNSNGTITLLSAKGDRFYLKPMDQDALNPKGELFKFFNNNIISIGTDTINQTNPASSSNLLIKAFFNEGMLNNMTVNQLLGNFISINVPKDGPSFESVVPIIDTGIDVKSETPAPAAETSVTPTETKESPKASSDTQGMPSVPKEALVPTTVVKPVTKKLLSDIKFANKVFSKKYAGKIVYASTGSGKTSIVKNFDNVVDGDVIQIDLIRDFLNKQLINGPHVVVDQGQAKILKDRMDKALASNNPKDRDDAIKSLIYDFTVLMNQSHTTSMTEFRRDVIAPAFKDAARQGKTVLTGSNFAKEIADFVFLQRNRLIFSVAMADMAPTKGNAVVTEIDNFLSEYILEDVDSPANAPKQANIDNKSLTQKETIVKEGVSELFESNPELANAVYEALGFVGENSDISTFTNYSGAAQGGDTLWENIGKEFGLGKQVNYRPEDLKKLTPEQLQEVENAYQQAVKDLGRKPLSINTFAGGLVRRDYLQAKAADAVFAISTIVEPGQQDPKGYVNKTNKPIVAGGTGYAVQMAINLGKPVYVFDQNKNQWFVWNNNTFEETVTPTLTSKFAGIGTREINKNGKQAIRDVYEKTTSFQITPEQKQQAQQLYSEYLDSLNTIELHSKLGNKTESGNVTVVKNIFTNKDNKDVITAFRVDKKLGLLESFRKYNAIGNPINWQGFKYRFEGDNATIAFMDWFLGKDYTDVEQEYRQEILNNLDNLKGKTIEYYKELGRPSHATALDYLINQLGSKQDVEGFKEFLSKQQIASQTEQTSKEIPEANSKDVHINTSSTSSYQVKQDLSDTIVAKPETSEAGDVTEAPSSEAANEAKNNMDSPRREFKKKGIQLGSSSGIIERARLAQNKAKDKSDDVKPKLAHSNAEKWDKREELAWLRRVLPNVPVRSLDNIKHVLSHGVEYWGAFYDAAIYLATNPGRGTVYHEAFHAVWNLYLTEDNKIEIQKAAESDSKFVKNYAIGKQITEESFANAFQDYMVERKKESIPSKILRFFKEIIMLARALAKRPIKNHEELFYRINLGSFRSGVKVSDKLVSKSLKTKVAGWSYAFQNEIIADLTKHIFKDIIPSVRNEDPRLSNKTDIEILNYIASVHGKESIYDAMYNNLIDLRNSGVITDQAILTNIDRTIELIDTGVLIPEIERYMAANVGIDMRGDFFKGVKFDSDESTIALEEERVKEGWQFEHTSVSAKDRAPIRVKNFIRFMDGGTMSPLGLQGRVDFDVTYNTLLSNLEGARTSTEIEQFLIENLPFHPEYQEILDEFRRDPSFKTAFFLAFQNTHTKYLVVSKMQKEGSYIVYDANRSGLVNNIISKWKNQLHIAAMSGSKLVSYSNGEMVINTEYAETLKNRLAVIADKLKVPHNPGEPALTKVEYDELSAICKEIGMDIEANAFAKQDETLANGFSYIRNIVSSNKSISTILNSFAKGVSPYDISTFDNASDGELSSVRALANFAKKGTPSLYESMFRGMDGKNKYSHTVPNFLSALVSKLNNKDEFKSLLEYYKRDQLFAHNQILLDLESRINLSQEEFEGLVDVHMVEGLAEGNRRVPYNEMNREDLTSFTINAYFNNGNKQNGYYRLTTLSDAPNMMVVKYSKRSFDEVIDSLIKVAGDEYNRIQSIAAQIKNGLEVKNYHTKANASTETGYHILQMFRGFKGDPSAQENLEKSRKILVDFFESKAMEYIDYLIDKGIVSFDENGNFDSFNSRIDERIVGKGSTINNFKERAFDVIKDFYANDFLVRESFGLLTVGDPAFYKSSGNNFKIVDFIKRAKQIYSPKNIIDINASYNGVSVGTTYKAVYISDLVAPGRNLSAIEEILSDAVKDGRITEAKFKSIMGAYNHVNATDAQAYVSLPFYKRTMIGLGRWTEAHELAYDRLMRAEGTANDIALVMQPLKPFAFGHYYDEKLKRIVPVQHKDSEFLLLPQLAYAKNNDGTYKNPALAALMDKMNDETNPIDIVLFESAVKVGANNVVDIKSNEGNIAESLRNNIVPEMIHEMSMENRGIQVETPESFIDHESNFGTQIRTLIMANLVEGVDYIIDGNREVPLTKKAKELKSMFEDAIKADLEEAYKNIKEEFLNENGSINWKSVSELLIKEARSKGKGEDIEYALEYDAINDRLRIPLFNPATATMSQNMITSIFKNRITKQEIAGGSFIQATSFGFSDYLRIVRHSDAFRPSYVKLAKRFDVEIVKGRDGSVRKINVKDKNRVDDKSAIGLIQFSKSKEYDGFLSIGIGFVNEDYRNQGIFKDMFRAMMENLPEGVKGLVSPIESRNNKVEVPHILNELSKEYKTTILENGDMLFELKPDAPKFEGPDGVAYAEALLPAWSKKFLKDFINENGEVDFDKVNEALPEVLDMIGYRIPTEDKYSMLPIRVVGFLPYESGGAIMLPYEITTLSGSDFDVDKMYVMMKAFKRSPKGKYSIIKFHEEPSFEAYKDYVLYNSSKDDASYLMWLSEQERKTIIKNARESFDVMMDAIREERRRAYDELKESIKNSDAKDYIDKLNKHRATLLSDLSEYSKERFSSLKDDLDSREVFGAPRTIEYVNLTIELLDESDISEVDRSVLNEILLVQNEILRSYGLISDTFKEFHQEALKAKKADINKHNEILKEKLNKLNESVIHDLAKMNGLPSYETFEAEFSENIMKYNTKPARDNFKIDLMRAVLTSPHMSEQLLTPGGFEELEMMAELFQKLTGKNELDLAPFDLTSNDEMSERNLVGKRLVPTAVNQNLSHALTQGGGLSLMFPIAFDGVQSGDLGNVKALTEYELFYNDNGEVEFRKLPSNLVKRTITKNLALPQAAVVDHAKNPVVSFLGYTMDTAPMASLIMKVGFDPLTAMAFVSNPVVKEAVEYSRKNGVRVSDAAVAISKELGAYNIKNDVVDLSTEGLVRDLNKPYESFSKDEKFKILASLYSIALQAEDMSTLIRALRSQSKPAGPRVSDMEIAIRTVEDVYDEGFSILGAHTVVGSATGKGLASMFHNIGIERPYYEIMHKIYPYSNALFSSIKRRIYEATKGRLSADDITKIDNFIAASIVSKFDYFYTGKDDGSSYIERFATIVKNTPIQYMARVKELAAEYPEVANNKLVNLIEFKRKDDDNPIDRLVLSNPGALSKIQAQEARDAFYDLLSSSNPKIANLGRYLATYAAMTTGFMFTPDGFGHLIPSRAYTEIFIDTDGESLADFMYDIITGGLKGTLIKPYNIVESFFRNNYSNERFVPRVYNGMIDKGAASLDNKNGVMLINTESPLSAKFVISQETLAPYISYNDKGNIRLFKISRNVNDSTAEYKEVSKFGIYGKLTEYDPDNTGRSIIDSNNVKQKDQDVFNFSAEALRRMESHESAFNEVEQDKSPDVQYMELVESLKEVESIPVGNKNYIFKGNDSIDMRDALKAIANGDHPLSELAKKLQKFSYSGVKINIVDSIDGGAPGVYYANLDKIEIARSEFSKRNVERLILHEIMHALTVKEIKNNPKLQKDLGKMLIFAREHLDPNTYGLKDIYEFAAEAMVNAKFIQELSKLEPISDIKPYKNLFQQLVDFFIRVLKISNVADNLHVQAVSVISYAVASNKSNIESMRDFYFSMNNVPKSEYYSEIKMIYDNKQEASELIKKCR